MKTAFRVIAYTVVFLFSMMFASPAPAQDRQIELNAELPAKRGLITSDIALAGRVYLPMGNFTIVGDLSFRDAVNLFLVPTDQINVEGQVWWYLTGKPSTDAGGVKPFVLGGITRAMFIGQPLDSTTGLAGFGVAIRKPNGFHAIPTIEFDSDDLEEGRTVLGKKYAAKVYLHIPLASASSNFNLNLTPRFARVSGFGGYQNEYALSIGFGRKF